MYHLIIILLLIVFLFLYLNATSRRKIDFSSFEKKDIAHRGLYDNNSLAPENSMYAFNKAIEASYGIEMDIRLTKDKQVVIFHDDNMLRMTGKDINVNEADYCQIKDIKLLQSNETIPLFADFLALVNGKVPLIIELKCSVEDYNELCSLSHEILKDYQGIYCLESFNPYAMAWYKRNDSKQIRGQLSSGHFNNIKNPIVNFMMRNLLFNNLSRPDFIAYDHNYKNKLTFRLTRSIWKVKTVAYTVKDQDSYNDNKEVFDGIIFDSFIPKA